MSYKIKQLLEKQKRSTIYTLHGSQNLEEALDAMSRHRIHHLPIVQQGTAKEGDYGVLEGIISDRDLRLVTQSPLYYDGANQKGDRHSKKNIESLEEGLSELSKINESILTFV
jgi:signal-transduction protein with cAMP-binding, CBS, and nucleotidyltransferase domain